MSRTLPPSSSYSGTLYALALISHNAISIALTAEAPTPVVGKKPQRDIVCQRCSILLAGCPSRLGFRASIKPTCASSRNVSPASPIPLMPASVSTSTNMKLRSRPTTYVLMSVIFILNQTVGRIRLLFIVAVVLCYHRSL